MLRKGVKSSSPFRLLAFTACTKPEKEVYIFTSHREPALDGLHYLYSYDGYHWDSIATISTVQSMEPSKPKAPPFIRLASGSRRASKPLQNLFPLTS